MKTRADSIAQAERTVRDWLSYQLRWDFGDAPPPRGGLIGWHEGARLSNLLAAVPVRIEPATGVLAAHHEGRWLAPDAAGVFRFEVLEDKIRYPTTRAHAGLALLTPATVHYGETATVLAGRRDILAAAYAKNPQRFVRRVPQPAEPPNAVWMNPPKPSGANGDLQ